MGPTHTTRNGQRFRYYVTHPKSIAEGDPPAYRIAADAIERICLKTLAEHVAGQVHSINDEADAKRIGAVLTGSQPNERRALIVEHIRKVVVGDAELTIELADGTRLHRSLQRVRHGNDAKLVVGELGPPDQPNVNPQLLILLQDARRARELALAKPHLPLDPLAAKFGRSAERYKRLARFSYLSPTIVAAILEARQPTHVTNRFLQSLDRLPLRWAEQEQLLLG